MSQLYFVLTNSRCRSTWLANFLTFGPSVCLHDPSARASSMRELRTLLERVDAPFVGACDTGLALAPEVFAAEFPTAPVVVVTREPLQVARAVGAIMGMGPEHFVEPACAVHTGLLNVLRAIPDRAIGPLDCSVVTTWAGAKRIVKHVLPGVDFPEGRFAELRDVRVTPMYTRP